MDDMLRLTPTGEFLKQEDYTLDYNGKPLGFGLHTTHYFKLNNARKQAGLPVREDFKDHYDLRVGCGIDGTPFDNRPHPLLGKVIKNVLSEDVYIIEAVYKHFDYGYYWTLLIRREGTQSHGTLWWENINCKYDLIVNDIKQNREEYIIIW